ncbi:UNVERIFIED_CONTAM: hypothetical protein ABIC26_003933 [Paenibacillus sp. PvR008]
MRRRYANDLILRSLALLQIQILRFATDRRKVKRLLNTGRSPVWHKMADGQLDKLPPAIICITGNEWFPKSVPESVK